MTGFAMTLVITSAFIHAAWNFFAKRANGGVAFFWLFAVLGTVIYLPFAIAVVVLQRPHIGGIELLFMAGSALLHVIYFVLLLQGYRVGDLSLVYPLARGTGPLLATLAAIVFFGEQPTKVAMLGTLLIVVGVFAISGDPRKLRESGAGRAVVYALLTGVSIAMYTLWDKYAVDVLQISPLLYSWGFGLGMAVILMPFVIPQWEAVRSEWRTHRAEAVIVGIAGVLAYIM